MLSLFITVIGAGSLFVVLCGFAGLKSYVLEFTDYFDPDLTITPQEGKFMEVTLSRKQKLKESSLIAHYSEFIEERVFVEFKEKNEIAYIKAVDSSYANVIAVDSILRYGDWIIPGDGTTVVGGGIAQKLGMSYYEYRNPLKILVPKPGKGLVTDPMQAFNSINVYATGIYEVNESLNSKYIFTDITDARYLLRLEKNQATGIAFKLAPDADEDEASDFINEVFDNTVTVKNRSQMNGALYKMLQSENLAVYLIFTLVLIIALFNVAGAIMMMILDKKKDVKTLFSLGTTLADLKKIFFYQGVLTTLAGGLIGILIGGLLVWWQISTGSIEIAPGLAYPMEINGLNFIVSLGTIGVLGVIASYVASRRVTGDLLR